MLTIVVCGCGEFEEEEEEEEGEGEVDGEVEGQEEEEGLADGVTGGAGGQEVAGGVALSRSSEFAPTLALDVGVVEVLAVDGIVSASTEELISATEGEQESSSDKKAISTAMLSARRCLFCHLLNASLITALTTSLG